MLRFTASFCVVVPPTVFSPAFGKCSARLRSSFLSNDSDLWKIHPTTTMRVPVDVVVHAFATSMLGMMTWWLEQGTQYSAEEVSSYFRDLFFNGMLGVLEKPGEPPFYPPSGQE